MMMTMTVTMLNKLESFQTKQYKTFKYTQNCTRFH